MGKHEPIDPGADGIEQGRRLIRVDNDRGLSLTQKLAESLQRLAWLRPAQAAPARALSAENCSPCRTIRSWAI